MGNCCERRDRADITKDQKTQPQGTTYRPLYSPFEGAAFPAHAIVILTPPHRTSAPGRMISSAPGSMISNSCAHVISSAPPLQTSSRGPPPYYTLQNSSRYPGNAHDDKDQPDSSSPAPPSLATERTMQHTMAVTTAATSAEVVSVTEPEPVVDTVTSAGPQLQRSDSYQPCDMVISYHQSDKDVMLQIREQLEAYGLSVWVDQSSTNTGDDISKIGKAIIDAKFFISILSEKAVRCKYCRDEVALAYVSNTAIFPVNLQSRDILLPLMDTGLKLQLDKFSWTSLTDPATRADNIQALIVDQLTGRGPPGSFPPFEDASGTDVASPETTSDGSDSKEVTSPGDVAVTLADTDVTAGNGGGNTLQSPTSDGVAPEFKPMRNPRESNCAVMTLQGDDVGDVMPEQFWSEQFGVVDYVTWDRFTSALLVVFKEKEAMFTSEDQQQLLDILKRELEVDDDDRIYKDRFIGFCSVYGGVMAVWPRVQEQARESFAMREVFNMDSSVRVDAIENLGKFRSAAVIDALRDLLGDPEANVRAVATMSLSRTNANDPVTIRHILRTLDDKDHLVREAGCVALGHLRAWKAVSKLVQLWRTDVTWHVREAAAVALRQIGGQEVEDVMRETKVLAEEIRSIPEAKSLNSCVGTGGPGGSAALPDIDEEDQECLSAPQQPPDSPSLKKANKKKKKKKKKGGPGASAAVPDIDEEDQECLSALQQPPDSSSLKNANKKKKKKKKKRRRN